MLSTSTMVFSLDKGDAESSLVLRLLLPREMSGIPRVVVDTRTQSRQPGIVQPVGGGR